MGQQWLDGYSADVDVYLLIDDKRYDIAQIGGGSFILRGDHQIPAETQATLVIVVDGTEERQQIVTCEDARKEEPVAFF
jgi:hypothetical protein